MFSAWLFQLQLFAELRVPRAWAPHPLRRFTSCVNLLFVLLFLLFYSCFSSLTPAYFYSTLSFNYSHSGCVQSFLKGNSFRWFRHFPFTLISPLPYTPFLLMRLSFPSPSSLWLWFGLVVFRLNPWWPHCPIRAHKDKAMKNSLMKFHF